ncbi:isochorismatase family protein [Lentibacillus jeotgali]|uniref:isochorismatase family protein n=1 Tax=Lentibacillus jeotgali TaxID=558169 RepID=UPI00026283FA|nr:isochorismatase family protein [Lentibacillus jeotgali]
MEERTLSTYKAAGYGSGEIGIGGSPALLIIDFQKAFTSSESPLGGSEAITEAVDNTKLLLGKVRNLNIPVIHTKVAYRDDKQDMGLWINKVNNLSLIKTNSKWAELDDRVRNEESEIVLTKKMPSAFFNTDLISLLTSKNIDTLLVCGCTTSGCVRATVVDSFSYGFRTIVVEDCVGDQGTEPHHANLFDIKNRYGDLIPSEVVIERLEVGCDGK